MVTPVWIREKTLEKTAEELAKELNELIVKI